MTRPIALTERISIAPDLALEDYARIAALGYRTVISFLPDAEVAGAPGAAPARRAAEANGLAFVHVPAAKYDLFTDLIVSAAGRALREAKGPVLATCASGQRAAILWAAATARTVPVDAVLATLEAAGFDLAFLRDDLEAQAHRAHWKTEDGTAERAGSRPREAA